MGYWAKDGSYVREETDVQPMSQLDILEARKRSAAAIEAWEKEEARRKANEEAARQEYAESWREKERRKSAAFQHQDNQHRAVRMIVEQARLDYYEQSWLKRSFDKIRGKSFYDMKFEIEENALNKVERMSPERLERFIEEQNKGRSK